MHYLISDVHNDNRRLHEMLKLISFSEKDQLFILGDLFDRCTYAPDPVGVYFTILSLGEQCSIVRGNHDEWLAQYILNYFRSPEHTKRKLAPYPYNSFDLLQKRLTPMDMVELANWILSKPDRVELTLTGVHYLLAHNIAALCSDNANEIRKYQEQGLNGFVSIFGHDSTTDHCIWKNSFENVYFIDCGCGYRYGSLGCLCLETKQEFYVL